VENDRQPPLLELQAFRRESRASEHGLEGHGLVTDGIEGVGGNHRHTASGPRVQLRGG